MTRKYDESLLLDIKQKQYTKNMYDMDVLIKPIPDSNIKGAMDPRLYASAKKMAFMMRFIPKRFLKMDTSPEGIKKLRKMFNNVDSTPMVESDIKTSKDLALASDGYKIPVTVFTDGSRFENKPVLYYIHGGGFFAGHTGVVEEAMKLLVEKTGITVFSVDYRLAPENPYPVGHEDCYSGLKWVYEHAKEYGGNPNAIFVAGDSAGGNLTQYCTTRSLEDKNNIVKGQLLLYPTVNMGGISDSIVDFDLSKFEIYPKHKRAIEMSLTMMHDSGTMLEELLQTDEIMTPYLTPYMKVRDDNPPTFITVGEHDFLTIETIAYAKKLYDHNIDVKTVIYKGLGHAYIDHVGNYPQAEDCIEEMGQYILKYAKGL